MGWPQRKPWHPFRHPHGHPHHRHGPDCGSPDDRRRFYFRWRLQRRIFAWFGLTILITAVVAGMVARRNSVNMKSELFRGEGLLIDRFAAVWDQPAQRDDLGRAVVRELDVEIEMRDPGGAVVGDYGTPKCIAPVHTMSVEKDGRAYGTVAICAERFQMSTTKFLAPLALVFILLWIGSHAIARRLARPFAELERVASQIGKCNLKARFETDFRGRGGEDALAVGGAINDMASRIEKQLADQRALLATVSHEIRTPLARMRLLLELSKDAQTPKLDEIDREIVEIDSLVAELLAASRIDFAAATSRELVATYVAILALERAEVDASILDDRTGGAKLKGDPTLVQRAVGNLLQNARRHGGGPTKLRVTVRGGFVAFEVEDEGPGFTDGEEERIFEPFYKRSSDQGSVGLGLARVKRIAEAHGGHAFARNRKGKGAIVGVELAV
ncbi:HAMP domain-containing sensor histidine kinase [soil metagenome]